MTAAAKVRIDLMYEGVNLVSTYRDLSQEELNEVGLQVPGAELFIEAEGEDALDYLVVSHVGYDEGSGLPMLVVEDDLTGELEDNVVGSRLRHYGLYDFDLIHYGYGEYSVLKEEAEETRRRLGPCLDHG